MFRKSEQVKLDGQDELTVKELTVDELDGVLGKLDKDRKTYWAEVLFDSPIPVEVVTASTGLKQEDMGKLTPSELHEVWTAVAKVNDFLFNGLQRLAAFSEKLLAENKSGSADSLPS